MFLLHVRIQQMKTLSYVMFSHTAVLCKHHSSPLPLRKLVCDLCVFGKNDIQLDFCFPEASLTIGKYS